MSNNCSNERAFFQIHSLLLIVQFTVRSSESSNCTGGSQPKDLSKDPSSAYRKSCPGRVPSTFIYSTRELISPFNPRIFAIRRTNSSFAISFSPRTLNLAGFSKPSVYLCGVSINLLIKKLINYIDYLFLMNRSIRVQEGCLDHYF